MNSDFHHRFLKGFTLMELMVSISIFGVISGVVIANLHDGTLRGEVALGASTLVEAIREANSRTASGEVVSICSLGADGGRVCPASGCAPGGTCVEVLPLGGFGIFLDQNNQTEYTLFADINNNFAYDAGENIRRGKFIVSGNVRINSFTPIGSSLNITFRPPKPKGYINGGTIDSFADIILGSRLIGDTRAVHFERVSGAVGIR